MSTKELIVDELKGLLNDSELDYQQFLELTSNLIKYDEKHLRFSTDSGTLTHLGRDSIKDQTTAVVELVKNGYDADASAVEINIFLNDKESYIRIADSGIGMSQQDVVDKWLRIGFSSKRIDKITEKRRRKTGEKGIGRLSADRLGATISLKTKMQNNDIFGLEINWNDFNQQGVDLHLVPFKKITSPSIKLPVVNNLESESGTEIIITDLRNIWSDSDLKRLYEELSLLTSPFRVVDDFKITINSNIESEYKGEIKPKDHLQPEVEISVYFDGDSKDIKYILKDKYSYSDAKEKSISWEQLSQKSKDKKPLLNDIKKFDISEDKPKCGPIIFDLMFYPREVALIKDTGFTLPQLKEYLSYNGGVKIYRDNISVKPYGFSGKDGEDWLNLGERQGQNPAGIGREDWMVKNNQLLGAVYISRDENDLLDSAAREGLVHNEAYYDLRALVLCGVRLLELHRHNIHKNRNTDNNKTPRKSSKKVLEEYKTELESLRKELHELKQEAQTNSYLISATQSVDAVLMQTKETEKTIEEILNKNRTLGGLATIGIASAVFGHETQLSISQFKFANSEAIEALQLNPPDIKEAFKELHSAKEYSEHVSQWGSFALTRIKRDKRTKKTVNVHKLIENTINDIRPTFSSRAITININELEEVKAKTFSMDIETIIINLLTNSYSACLHNSIDRQINISLQNRENEENIEGFEITISDSGNGIDEKLREIIWEALYTTKTDDKGNDSGTGLGLTIVQSIIDDLNGTRMVDNDDTLKGARFKIWLPKK
jgi:signal transduction histidine kinase